MHHPHQSDPGVIGRKEEEEESCDASTAAEDKGKKKKDPQNQSEMFKCELCEEEEFDSELYYHIHMKAHGSPNNTGPTSLGSDEEDDTEKNDSKAGLQKALKSKGRSEKEDELLPVQKSSLGSETGRYQLRTTLKPTASSSLLHHMMNKSRLNRSGEGVEPVPSNTEKRKNEFDEESPRSPFSNGGARSSRENKAKSAKLLTETEEEGSALQSVPADEIETPEEGDAATIVCPICSETLNTADEESLCIHMGCHREGTPQFHCLQCKDVIKDSWKEMQQHLLTHVDDSVEMPPLDLPFSSLEKPENSSLRSSSDKNRVMDVSGREPIVCPRCSIAGFASMEEFDFHLEFHDDDDEQIHCPLCSQVEESWATMLPHLTAHPEVPPAFTLPNDLRTCKDCNRMLENSELLEKHVELFHHLSCSYLCEQCGKHFFSIGRLACHKESHKSACYECSECQIQTTTLQAMLEHQRIHQGLGVTCNICQKSFPRESQLQFHEKIHRKRDELTICDQCGCEIHGSCALRYHMRHFHIVVPQLWPCPSCTYVGKTKNNLQGHMDRTHNKPCKCSKCDYSCVSEKMLARHVDMFHKQSEKTFLLCQLCPFRTDDSKAMTEHWRLRHHHKASETMFQCPTCQVQFKTRELLKDHLPLHTGKKAYYCKLCVYSAKYRPTIYRHVLNKHPGQTLADAVIVGDRDSCAYVHEQQQDAAGVGTSEIGIVSPLDAGPQVATNVNSSVTEVQSLDLGSLLFRSSDRNVVLPSNLCLQVVEGGGQSVDNLTMMQLVQTGEAPKIVQASLGDGKTIQLLLVSEGFMQSAQNNATVDTSGMQFFAL